MTVEVGGDWLQLVSNLLGLPKNEPDTRTVAAQLLPHALAAVEREYYGRSSASETRLTSTPAASPIRAVLAHADNYLQGSQARYERSCYVIMPFGQKRTDDSKTIDFDLLYHDLFMPAIRAVSLPDGGGLEPVRADSTLLSGVMPDELLSYLDLSRLVLADVTMANANVFYELGRRHRARESGTILIAQEDGITPFALGMERVLRYSIKSATAMSASRAMITDVLRQTVNPERPPL
jgi:hypothetical protein